MLLQCLECNYICGNIAVLKYHYESFHKDKTDKCMCGNKILSGICANNFSPWVVLLKMNLVLVLALILVLTLVLILILILVLTLVLVLTLILTLVLTLVLALVLVPFLVLTPVLALVLVLVLSMTITLTQILTPIPNPNLIPNPNPNLNPSSEVLTRCCNKCNYIKPLNNFDGGKYTCRNCTSAKVNCPYCTSIVKYDGIRAHVKKQHPDIELTRGFSRNLQSRFPDITDRGNRFGDKTFNPSWQSPRAVSPLVINQTEESWSCKYYNFVSFLINNGINIEKIKEIINLLKSIDNLK